MMVRMDVPGDAMHDMMEGDVMQEKLQTGHFATSWIFSLFYF